MEGKRNGERGMSLVEVTIILMVLAFLTAVIAPAVGDYVNDSKQVKAKEDVEAIGTGLVRMLRDAGAPFPLRDPSAVLADRYKIANRVDLLVGPGVIPSIDTTAHPNFAPGSTEVTSSGSLNWNTATSVGGVELLAEHLVSNLAAYGHPAQTAAALAGSGGPQFGFGWRGAYLSGLSADPWGNRYAVNSVFFQVGSDSTVNDKVWTNDVAVLSAGANLTVDSTLGQSAFTAGLDDIVFVIQGSSR